MSQDRPSSRDGSTKIINMNHVLTHQSQMQYNNSSNNNNNNNNLILNKNNFLSIESVNNSNPHLLVHKSMNPMPSISSPPSIAASMSYITTISANGTDQNVINGNHHQIVLLTNEKVESSDNEQMRDEEERKVSTNGATDEELTSLTWLHDKNLLKGINLSCPKVQSPTDSRISIISKSPSDDKDDSGVSVDNAFNSSSEQIDHYTSPASPRPLNYTKVDSTSNNKISHVENTNSIQSLDKHSHSLSNSSQIDIIKLVAGQSNVIRDHYQSSHLSSEESINRIIKSPPTPHQHFHKRYLRETLKQQDEEKRQQEQLQQQNSSQLSSYIISKPQSGNQYIYNDEHHTVVSYHINNGSSTNNNNNNAQNNYENNCEYELSQKAIDYALPKLNSSASSVASSLSSSPSPKQKQHPNNIPYDPLIHISSKPPYSFSSLIFMAIEDSMQKALPVKEIYAWIIQHFPYFKTAPTGWKNSVRHNLSLNKCFQKVEKAANLGKGSLWMVEPQYRPNLIQALTRSPFHPCSTWEKHAKNLIKSPNESPGSKSNGGSTRLPNPDHFPFLSRRLAAAMENFEEDCQTPSRSSTPSTNYEMPQNFTNGAPVYQNNNSIIINGNLPNTELFARELNAETIDDVNAATAMLALKHGPKIFTDGIPFVQPPILTTTSPSEDHTYSAFGKNGTDNNSNGTSSDAAYESSEENNVVYHFTQPLNEQELEEQRRQAEGVDALLNLAGYNTNTTLLLKRPASADDDQQFERKQYFYTTEIAPSLNKNYILDDEPPSKKSKSRIMRNKLKRKSWNR